MSLSYVRTIFPWHFFLRRAYSLTGVVPLFLFLFLHFVFAYLLLFGERETVLGLITIQSNPVIATCEVLFISIPLLFHFVYGVSLLGQVQINVHRYNFAGNWRSTLQRACGVIVFLFILYHLFQTMSILFGNLLGYQYLQDVIQAHQSRYWMIAYWFVMLCAMYYFCNNLWGFLIDWGIAAGRVSQRFFLYGFAGVFCVAAVLILLIVGYQFSL